MLGGSFKARAFKGEKTKEDSPLKLPESINFISKDLKWSDGLTKKLKAMTEATTIARSLQDAPPNWLTPVRWADIAHECAKDWGIKVVTKTKAELEQLGMGSFLSVAQGSLIEPRLICFEIDGEKNDKTVAFVGKGLTFDAGGISLKPAAGMEEMKFDMSGGAAVFGTACYFARVKPKCKVVCLIGAVENMPSGTATRPSDIVRAMNGKTIEILNTDAEGRLVLADVLHYAETTYKPTVMLDIATLTGACVIALGRAGAGFLTPKDKAAEYFTQVTEKAGEPFWRLPLWPELSKEVKSEVADLKNIAKPGVMAGTILAAVFLKEFVEKTDWIHCDIAGTSDNCAATGFNKDNGSSYGLRTFVEFVEQIEQYPT